MGSDIVVIDYDAQWPAEFERLAELYQRALADVPVIAIEHVGSTSVPGLAAKPIIDIDIIVESDQVAAALAAMEAIGFESRGDLGIEDRWAMTAPRSLPATNTYVIVAGSVPLRNHLGVRDVLRSDAALRDEYGELKRSLASQVDDIADYVERKSELLSRVLRQAGLSDQEREEIEAANRSN